MAWQPAEALTDTSVGFHGMQEFMAQQRIAIPDQRIPLLCRNSGNPGVNLDFHLATSSYSGFLFYCTRLHGNRVRHTVTRITPPVLLMSRHG
jgi:hypothetical protein